MVTGGTRRMLSDTKTASNGLAALQNRLKTIWQHPSQRPYARTIDDSNVEALEIFF